MVNKKSALVPIIIAGVFFGSIAGLLFAGVGGTDAVTASVTINNYCTFTVSNTAINFGSMNPGTTTATTANGVVTVTDTGNVGSNILTSGTTWTFGSNTFGVQNTVWSPSSTTAYASANVLTGSAVNTNIIVTTTATNTIYYGLGIPAGQAPGTYSQTIDVISTC